MRRSRFVLALGLAVASCGVRAPARIDLAALVTARGPVEARHALELRVVTDPTDLGARLALAALDDRLGRPSDAIEQLELVITTGGPLGTRWHDDDRARLARLIAARGRARLERGALSAHADLARARQLGAKVSDSELARAKLVGAIAQLRHIDAAERAAAKRTLLELASTPLGDAAWRGASVTATPAQRGALGRYAWTVGARRAAWEELRAWHDATPSPRDEPLASLYLAARAWWTPVDAAPPPASDLVGPQRCRFASARCTPAEVISDAAAVTALLHAPPVRATTPADAVAWLSITLTQALHGEVGWGAAFAARVELPAIATSAIAPAFRAAFARISGRGDPGDVNAADLTPAARLVVAAARALRGASDVEVRAALGPAVDTEDGRAILRIVAPPAADRTAGAFATAVVDHVRARIVYGPDAAALRRVVDGYLRDPAIGDRLALDVIAEAEDAAAARAAFGALFDALGDPGRARVAWQAAVDASPEPLHLRGLAEAMARANDPDAAIIIGTTAAAAWGDPAIVWIGLARTLERVGRHQHALEAARSAIDLAGQDLLDDALAVAIDASRALGRTEQADALAQRRAKISPVAAAERDDDPTDASAALAELRRRPTASVVARMWVASRWNPREVAIRASLLAAIPGDDPRRGVIEAELVGLASDRDPEVGRAAVAALR